MLISILIIWFIGTIVNLSAIYYKFLIKSKGETLGDLLDYIEDEDLEICAAASFIPIVGIVIGCVQFLVDYLGKLIDNYKHIKIRR